MTRNTLAAEFWKEVKVWLISSGSPHTFTKLLCRRIHKYLICIHLLISCYPNAFKVWWLTHRVLPGRQLRVSHPYLDMPRSSFSFTMLNLGSVSCSSFCFSSIFSRSFCRSFSRRFWKSENGGFYNKSSKCRTNWWRGENWGKLDKLLWKKYDGWVILKSTYIYFHIFIYVSTWYIFSFNRI